MITELLDDVAELGGIFLDLSQRFDKLEYTEQLQEFNKDVAAGEQAAFAGERSPGGESWPELSPVTIARKGHDRILYETGRLEASLVSVGGPGNIHEIGERGSLFGTDAEYSLYHQLGGGRLPRREHVGTDSATVDDLADAIAEHVVESLK